MSGIKDLLRRSKRFARALIGRDLFVGRQVELPTESHGSEYGGWVTCSQGLDGQSIVYSFGVGDDVSFDLSLIEKFGLTVHGFDPTPRSIAWIESTRLPPEFQFHAFGVADFDGLASFESPRNPKHVSFTPRGRSERVEDDDGCRTEAQVFRVRTIMETLGHERIDLLKMDIEGGEYDVIQDLLRSGLDVRQLLVEFHHRAPGIGARKTREAVRALNDAGYRIFSVSPRGKEYSFVRLDRA